MRKLPLFAVLLTFALGHFEISALADPVVIERLEASVNSSLILQSDVKKFHETAKLRAQLDPLFSGTPVAEKGENAPVTDVVNFLVDESLIAQAFPQTDTEVEQEINSIQANNHIDRAQLKKALADQGFTFEEYFDLIRISASKRNLIDREIRTKVTISDDDVKNYFFNHYAKNASTPMEYHLQIIVVSVKNYKNAAGAKDTIQRAADSLHTGESFEEVAKQVSDGPPGGDLGTVTEDQISPVVREELKKLKIGEVSAPFGSTAGGAFYIVKIVDVKSGDTERYEKTKEEIRNQLAAQEYQHQIQLWLERQRQTAFIHRAGEPAVIGLPAANQ